VCPTPDLDLRDVEWTVHEVKPGTPYDDEPSEMIPPGWYVHGFPRGDDPFDASPIIVKIEQAIRRARLRPVRAASPGAWQVHDALANRRLRAAPRPLARVPAAEGIATFGRGDALP
jgi:hypothetical protein